MNCDGVKDVSMLSRFLFLLFVLFKTHPIRYKEYICNIIIISYQDGFLQLHCNHITYHVSYHVAS